MFRKLFKRTKRDDKVVPKKLSKEEREKEIKRLLTDEKLRKFHKIDGDK